MLPSCLGIFFYQKSMMAFYGQVSYASAQNFLLKGKGDMHCLQAYILVLIHINLLLLDRFQLPP